MILVFFWKSRSTVGFMFKSINLTARKKNWSVGGLCFVWLCSRPAPSDSSCFPPPAACLSLLFVFLLHAPSRPPSSEGGCLVLSPGLNHASEMEKAPRLGPVWLEELGLSFECDIKVHNEGFAADSRLEGRCGWRHGYRLLGCGPKGMLKPSGWMQVRKNLLFLWEDLRASCGLPHPELLVPIHCLVLLTSPLLRKCI